jgi:hypothetical protein
MTIQPYDYNAAALDRLNQIKGMGTSALAAQQQMAALRNANTTNYTTNTPANTGTVQGAYNFGNIPKNGTGRNTFQNFQSAIAKRESGGNYKAVNKDSGALGKYQVMPGNIAGWSKEALGHSISTSQYLNSPQLQEQIATYKLQQYYNKYGPGGAAVAWYAGPGNANKWIAANGKGNTWTRPQGSYSSISAYAYGILKSMGLM